MQGGYPRFFIHRIISTLAEHIVNRFDSPPLDLVDTRRKGPVGIQQLLPRVAILFPARQGASQCERFLLLNAKDSQKQRISILPLSISSSQVWPDQTHAVNWSHLEFYAILYPSDLSSLAKSFWQHTGFGISSRYAELCLSELRHVNIRNPVLFERHTKWSTGLVKSLARVFDVEEDKQCKDTLRQRIASERASSENVSLQDVFLYPTGMCAITKMAEAVPALPGDQRTCEVVIYG